MPWDMSVCKWGVPADFTDDDALAAVKAADFTKSVFVNTSAKERKTRQAYTYVTVKGYRLCVVGHLHQQPDGSNPGSGNCFIPGWENWDVKTASDVVAVIAKLPDGGTWLDDERYPHPAV
ncbi:hypothetical protein [Streptomyces fumanus]|nr:hypothetical protein [Streptomyces fumanus]